MYIEIVSEKVCLFSKKTTRWKSTLNTQSPPEAIEAMHVASMKKVELITFPMFQGANLSCLYLTFIHPGFADQDIRNISVLLVHYSNVSGNFLYSKTHDISIHGL